MLELRSKVAGIPSDLKYAHEGSLYSASISMSHLGYMGNLFMNVNLFFIGSALKEVLTDAISELVLKLANQVFSDIPYDKLFLQ